MSYYIIGIDIGTESSRVILFEENGKVLSSSSSSYPTYYQQKNYVEQNPNDWWKSVFYNLKEILNNYQIAKENIIGLGVCGQMHAVVPIGKDGNLLSDRVPIWCDKRSDVSNFHDKDLNIITGNPAMPTWTGFKIRWLKDHNQELYNKTYKFLSCKDFINYMLTGQIYTDFSEASGTYLFDIKKNNWSTELCNLLEIDYDKLPPIKKSAEIIGKIKKSLLKDFNLNKEIKVVCGGGDMMCLLLGSGMIQQGIGCDVTGTASDVSVCVISPLIDSRIMNLHHVVNDLWVSFGILDSGGGSLQWFKNNFGSKECEIAKEKDISVYKIFDQEALSIPPGSGGLLFFPYLNGERTLGSKNSRGVFFGIDSTHQKNHFIRAIMEGVAYDLRQSLDIIREKVNISELHAIGGGAKSKIWIQIKSNIYNIPVVTLRNFEGGAIGAAILAGVGVKLFKDEKEAARRMIKKDNKIFPSNREVVLYKQYYDLYKKLHDEFQRFYDDLSKVSKEYIK